MQAAIWSHDPYAPLLMQPGSATNGAYGHLQFASVGSVHEEGPLELFEAVAKNEERFRQGLLPTSALPSSPCAHFGASKSDDTAPSASKQYPDTISSCRGCYLATLHHLLHTCWGWRVALAHMGEAMRCLLEAEKPMGTDAARTNGARTERNDASPAPNYFIPVVVDIDSPSVATWLQCFTTHWGSFPTGEWAEQRIRLRRPQEAAGSDLTMDDDGCEAPLDAASFFFEKDGQAAVAARTFVDEEDPSTIPPETAAEKMNPFRRTTSVRFTCVPVTAIDGLPPTSEIPIPSPPPMPPHPPQCASSSTGAALRAPKPTELRITALTESTMRATLYSVSHVHVKDGTLDRFVRELCDDKRYPYQTHDPDWCLQRPFCFRQCFRQHLFAHEPCYFLLVISNVGAGEQMRMNKFIKTLLNPDNSYTGKTEYWDWEAPAHHHDAGKASGRGLLRGKWLNHKAFSGFLWAPQHHPRLNDEGAVASWASCTAGGSLRWRYTPAGQLRSLPEHWLTPTGLAARALISPSSENKDEVFDKNGSLIATHHMELDGSGDSKVQVDLGGLIDELKAASSPWAQVPAEVWSTVLLPFLSLFDAFRAFSRVSLRTHCCFQDIYIAKQNPINDRAYTGCILKTSFAPVFVTRGRMIDLAASDRNAGVLELHPAVAADVWFNATGRRRSGVHPSSSRSPGRVQLADADRLESWLFKSAIHNIRHAGDNSLHLCVAPLDAKSATDKKPKPVYHSENQLEIFELGDPMQCVSFRENLLASEAPELKATVLNPQHRRREWRPTDTPWTVAEQSAFALGGPDRPVFVRDPAHYGQHVVILLVLPRIKH